MPLIKRCCFSKNLRAGSIASGIWTLVWCLYLLGTSLYILITIGTAPIDDESSIGADSGIDVDSDIDGAGDDIVVDSPNNVEAMYALVWLTLCVAFLTFLSSLIVIAAVFMDNPKLMIPWMVMVVCLLALDATTILMSLIVYGFMSSLVAFLTLWIVISLVNTYCELCVISHYQELSLGRGRPQDYSGHVMLVVRPPVRQVLNASHTAQSEHTVYSFDQENIEYHDPEAVDRSLSSINSGSFVQCNGDHKLMLAASDDIIHSQTLSVKSTPSVKSDQPTNDAIST